MLSSSALSGVVWGVMLLGANAQTTVWNQCGGFSFPGDTNCEAGTVCYVLNPYYSQCIPITSVPSTTTTSRAPAPTIPATQHWFSFGDSYTQIGFNISGAQPSTENPIGNPQYPGHTACGMVPNWVDIIAVKYNRTTLLTYNFADSGATIDANLVKPYNNKSQSFNYQVNTFLDNQANVSWVPADTLFSIWFGINDIGNSYWLEGDRDAFSDTLLDAYFVQVQKLYDVGGRTFTFTNIPDIDQSPLMLTQPESARAAEKIAIDSFNAKLVDRAASFKASHSGVKSWVLYSNFWMGFLLPVPTSFGFKDNSTYGAGDDVMWCNEYHPSSRVHGYFAKSVANVLCGLFTYCDGIPL